MSKSQIKTCQNCQSSFEIDASDFEFYEKISVPPPTWCPECRAIRRWSFRNERNLYRRICDLCKNDIISMYGENVNFPVYCQECWWSDKWDPLKYGQEFNFNKSFFEQNKELRLKVPRVAIINKNSVNSLYTNISANNKNCYFLIESSNNEECLHGYWLEKYCRNVVDSAFITKSELIYESLFVWNSYKLFLTKECDSCTDSMFILDCVNISNCFGCVNLRNKQYHIFNKPYTKEEYKKQIEYFNLGSYSSLEKFKKEFYDFAVKFIKRSAYIKKSINSSGNYIVNSKDCIQSFYIEDAENVKYGIHVFDTVKDHMDVDTIGLNGSLCYESINTGLGVNNMRFCMRCWTGFDSLYCDNCDDIKSSFACIGLRNKQYCILNKQYAKEEYEKLVPKIIQHMNDMPYIDKKGRIYKYGEFFPPELSPFAYNETIAQEYFPLTKEQALEKGYQWKEPEQRDVQITISNSQLPDHIKDVDDDIVNQIIECANASTKISKENLGGCTQAFKIIKPELDFYRKMNLPLPRLCPNCRHYQRLKQRNPLKLWKRKCQCAGEKSSNGVYQNTIKHFHGAESCPNEFQTTYSPDRQEIIYCEKCYQAEVV